MTGRELALMRLIETPRIGVGVSEVAIGAKISTTEARDVIAALCREGLAAPIRLGNFGRVISTTKLENLVERPTLPPMARYLTENFRLITGDGPLYGIGYDEDRKLLELEFRSTNPKQKGKGTKTRKLYRYFDVTPDVYRGFSRFVAQPGPALMKAFRDLIRGRYPYKRVK